MRFVTARDGEDFAKLSSRLFCHTPKSALAGIIASLKEANPGLASHEKFLEGTVVIVPELEDVQPPAEARTGSQVVAALLTQALEMLAEPADAENAASARFSRAENQARLTLELAGSKAVHEIVSRHPDVQKRLKGIAEGAHADLERSGRLRKSEASALDDLRSDLKGMLELFGPSALRD